MEKENAAFFSALGDSEQAILESKPAEESPSVLVCDRCDYTSAKKANLHQHRLRHHPKAKVESLKHSKVQGLEEDPSENDLAQDEEEDQHKEALEGQLRNAEDGEVVQDLALTTVVSCDQCSYVTDKGRKRLYDHQYRKHGLRKTKLDSSSEPPEKKSKVEERTEESNVKKSKVEERTDESNAKKAKGEERTDESNAKKAKVEERTDESNAGPVEQAGGEVNDDRQECPLPLDHGGGIMGCPRCPYITPKRQNWYVHMQSKHKVRFRETTWANCAPQDSTTNPIGRPVPVLVGSLQGCPRCPYKTEKRSNWGIHMNKTHQVRFNDLSTWINAAPLSTERTSGNSADPKTPAEESKKGTEDLGHWEGQLNPIGRPVPVLVGGLNVRTYCRIKADKRNNRT